MVAFRAPRYGARCMTATRPRRARTRRALLILPVALGVAVGSVTIGPVLWAQRAPELAATNPSPSLGIGALSPAVSPTPVATPTRTPRPSATTAVTAAGTPTANGPASSAGSPIEPPDDRTRQAPLTRSPHPRPDRRRHAAGHQRADVDHPTASGSADPSRPPGAAGPAPRALRGPRGLGGDRAAGRLHVEWGQRPRRRRDRHRRHPLHVVRPRERQQDVHRRPRSWRSWKTGRSTSTRRSAGTCRASRRLGRRSGFASCSTTRAGCATTSSSRRSTTCCCPAPIGAGTPATGAASTSARRTSSPGKGWHYSNTNYLVLGMLAEAVGGAPLADQVRERLLRPLGLEHTWYQPEDPAPRDVAHGYRFTSTSPKAARDRPLRRHAVRAVHIGRDRRRAAPAASPRTRTDLARWAQRPVRRRRSSRPEYLAAMTDVASDRPRYKPTSRTARRPGRRHRRPPEPWPLRPPARLPLGRPVPARSGRHDRRAHQPEPDRPGRRSCGRCSRRRSPRSTTPAVCRQTAAG